MTFDNWFDMGLSIFFSGLGFFALAAGVSLLKASGVF